VTNGFNKSCQGYSHAREGLVCQDASGYHCGEGYAVVVAADGHGGEKYFRSDIGSDIAVKEAIKAIKKLFENKDDYKQKMNENPMPMLRHLAGYISAKWIEQIQLHYINNKLRESEQEIFQKYFITKADTEPDKDTFYSNNSCNNEKTIMKIYGTTLILGVITGEHAFVINNGDGAVVFSDANGDCLIPQETVNEDLVVHGPVTSLSDSNVLESFRYYYTENIPSALILSTDGVSESFTNDGFLITIKELLRIFQKSKEDGMAWLDEWLPKISQERSGDDMTLAGIYAIR